MWRGEEGQGLVPGTAIAPGNGRPGIQFSGLFEGIRYLLERSGQIGAN